MSRKFVLVPQDEFNAISGNTNNKSKDIIHGVPNEMKNAMLELNKNKLKKMAKKELYNQYLADYIKLKKERAKRPINVRLHQDALKKPSEIRMKRQAGFPIETPYFYPTPPSSRSASPDGSVKSSLRSMSEDFRTHHSSELDDSVGSAGEYGRKHEEPGPSKRLSIYDMAHTPARAPPDETMYEKMSRTETNMKRRQNEIKTRRRHAEEITKTIMEEPDRYGVTVDGEIINPATGRKYVNARKNDVKQAVLKMLGSAIQFVPAGYKRFKERVEANEAIRSIIDSVSFTPEKWNR